MTGLGRGLLVWLAAGMLSAPALAATDPGYETALAAARAAMLRDPVVTVDQARIAERAAGRIADPGERAIAIATARWLQGEADVRLDEIARAAPLVAQAYATVVRRAPGSKLMADILLTRGGLHTSRAEVAQALADYQQAHDIYRAIDDQRSRAIALSLIANLYQEGKDNQTALRYFSQASDAFHGDDQLMVSIYNNRADALKELGRYPDAEAQFREALALARQLNSPVLEAQIIRNIARTQLAAGRLREAARTVAEGHAVSARAGTADEPAMLAVAAQVALQEGRLGEAETLIARSFAGVDLAHTSISAREAHETAYRIYRARNEPAQALQHLAALKRLDDEATRVATSTGTALMAARFDFANQELRIAKLKQDELQRNVVFERERARSQRTIFFGTAAATALVIVLLLIGLVTIRRSRDKVRAAADDLAVTNQALAKALAAKTEFLATTSHEIRTPLNGILGMTQVMLVDPALGADLRDRLRVVHGAGTTMKALVDDILDVAKMETGNLTIEDAPFDLRATIADSTLLWQDQARAKGVTFARDLAECPGMVMGDAARVRQIVFNLLSNALKFTAEGGIVLRIVPAAAGTRYQIRVSDSGVGIASDKRDEIFESFRQADTSTTRQFGGTGLGLSICRNLARAMGGDVTVDSVVGQGLTFLVDLPLVAAAAAEPVPAAADDATTLLIVERNPIARSMLKTLVSPHVGAVAVAVSVDEALAQVAAGRVARILADDATVAAADGLARLAATGLPLTVLASAPDDVRAMLETTKGATVIAKPVSGALLVSSMFSAEATDGGPAPLVSQAA